MYGVLQKCTYVYVRTYIHVRRATHPTWTRLMGGWVWVSPISVFPWVWVLGVHPSAVFGQNMGIGWVGTTWVQNPGYDYAKLFAESAERTAEQNLGIPLVVGFLHISTCTHRPLGFLCDLTSNSPNQTEIYLNDGGLQTSRRHVQAGAKGSHGGR